MSGHVDDSIKASGLDLATPVDATILAHFPLFADIPETALDELGRALTRLELPPNELLLEQGQESTDFFIVDDGALAVYRDAVGEPVQLLSRLTRGDYFGEMALFGTGVATASVRATEASRVLHIAGADFKDFVERFANLQLQLQMAATRRHSANLASVLEMGRRREVRIRCNRSVPVILENGERREMVLENLSLGGLCLTGAPEQWTVPETVAFALTVREGSLSLSGSVRWRVGDSVGICFDKRSPRHDMLVQMAIRLILEAAY